MPRLEVGKGQMKVLRVLWEKRRATAQEITDILNLTEPIKFSSVYTFLRLMVRNGIVGYDVEDRTYIYFPLVEEEKIANHAVKDLVNHIFSGSLDGFVSFMLKEKYISPEAVAKAQGMLDKKE
jgi:BlaI family transcriptional regulator, penicillinase repressor